MTPSEFENWIDAYIDAQEIGVVDDSHPLWWAIDRFMDFIQSDPERAWDAILSVARRRPSEKVLGMLAAGPLEDLVDQHGEAFIDRIEKEASSDPEFKRMLQQVWESGSPEVWARVLAVREPL